MAKNYGVFLWRNNVAKGLEVSMASGCVYSIELV